VSGQEIFGADADAEDGKEIDKGSHLRTLVEKAIKRVLSMQG
jgi:hypothetical protein